MGALRTTVVSLVALRAYRPTSTPGQAQCRLETTRASLVGGARARCLIGIALGKVPRERCSKSVWSPARLPTWFAGVMYRRSVHEHIANRRCHRCPPFFIARPRRTIIRASPADVRGSLPLASVDCKVARTLVDADTLHSEACQSLRTATWARENKTQARCWHQMRQQITDMYLENKATASLDDIPAHDSAMLSAPERCCMLQHDGSLIIQL